MSTSFKMPPWPTRPAETKISPVYGGDMPPLENLADSAGAAAVPERTGAAPEHAVIASKHADGAKAARREIFMELPSSVDPPVMHVRMAGRPGPRKKCPNGANSRASTFAPPP